MSEDDVFKFKGADFRIFKVFCERWRRQNRIGEHNQEFDNGWQLDGIEPDQTIGNYGSLHELHEQLHDALTREEARV